MAGWLVSSFLLAAFALSVLACVGWLRFGSARATLDFLSGERIVVDSPAKSFGSLPSGEVRDVSFLITNMSGRPLGLAGSSTKCPCAITTGLPTTIPSLGQMRIDVRVTRSAKDGPFDQEITLFLDDRAERTMRLRVTGVIVPKIKIGEARIPNRSARP